MARLTYAIEKLGAVQRQAKNARDREAARWRNRRPPTSPRRAPPISTPAACVDTSNPTADSAPEE
jgi:hypothetical protein